MDPAAYTRLSMLQLWSTLAGLLLNSDCLELLEEASFFLDTVPLCLKAFGKQIYRLANSCMKAFRKHSDAWHLGTGRRLTGVGIFKESYMSRSWSWTWQLLAALVLFGQRLDFPLVVLIFYI